MPGTAVCLSPRNDSIRAPRLSAFDMSNQPTERTFVRPSNGSTTTFSFLIGQTARRGSPAGRRIVRRLNGNNGRPLFHLFRPFPFVRTRITSRLVYLFRLPAVFRFRFHGWGMVRSNPALGDFVSFDGGFYVGSRAVRYDFVGAVWALILVWS